jgi:hypothetical protein
LILVCAVAAGCGGGGGDSGISAETRGAFEGVYALETATENPSSCDTEGPSNLESFSDRQFVAVGIHVLTTTGLQISSCADDAACATIAAKIAGGQGWGSQWGWFMSSEVSPDEVAGFSASTGFLQEGVCTQRVYTDLSFSRQGDAVRLEIRATDLADVPADHDTCWVDPTTQRQEAAARPCTSLAVLTGTKLGPLP